MTTLSCTHGLDEQRGGMKGRRKQACIGAALVMLLALGQLTGCAMSGGGGPVAAVVDDATITAGVRAAIVDDPMLKVADIAVETEQGVVQLSGFVSSADSVAAAASVARTVRGVKSVRNDLRLK
ncbi:BON domain-containing protein [Massilia sp. IC2-477]|uniref:BON domain-containing protein n=1 Tax=Massilia sp. IC2-477 TaxID=2887198 RepID=UPI001D101CFF|nr:BON domain-containing protein [Massilia sp. IC2-477]MCC2956400.1 BON domain-containing protein [Massilia sp. IC2-477]